MTSSTHKLPSALQGAKDAFSACRFDVAIALFESWLAANRSSAGSGNGWDLAWLHFIACQVAMGRVADADMSVYLHQTRPGPEAALATQLGSGIIATFQARDPNPMRIALERVSQGWNCYPHTDYPSLLMTLDQHLISSHDVVQRPAHDYRTTSYLQWKGGLADVVTGRTAEALPRLLDSMHRYALAGLKGDALWSWFDVISCHLLLGLREEAWQLYRLNADIPELGGDLFVELAGLVLKAFESCNEAHLVRARQRLSASWNSLGNANDDFTQSEYPSIFKALAEQLHGRSPAALSLAQAKPPTRSNEEDPENYRYVIVRPVVPADLDSIVEIVEDVDLASMRKDPDMNSNFIRMSMETLAGKLTWRQGLLFLALEMAPTRTSDHPYERSTGKAALGDRTAVVGTTRLQIGWGGCWKVKPESRHVKIQGKSVWANHQYLVYQPNERDQYALEFAGTSVHKQHQGKRLSKVLTQARVLFILLHQSRMEENIKGDIAYLYANLLTTDKEGKYPFFERIVKPLFGGLDYDTMDNSRYDARSDARSPILDEFLDQRGDNTRANIPHHLLPGDILENLGRVRRKTKPAEKNLLNFGFEKADKYDVLDGGRYYENNIATLEDLAHRTTYTVERTSDQDIPADSPRLTFAPLQRSMKDFWCARAQVRVEKNRLLISDDLYVRLNIQNHERVIALDEPPRRSAPCPVITEVNFDSLVGPTHNYSALSHGNIKSMSSQGKDSKPREAALQGLAKMKLLHDLGIRQGVLPPLDRPFIAPLRQLGFSGRDEVVLKEASEAAPMLLAACYSASAMWAANCATVTPAHDSQDGLVHFTPANLISKFHRALEADLTAATLRRIFVDEGVFEHHEPLPRSQMFADEGAANHIRFCSEYGGIGLHLFVYGRDENNIEIGPKKFPARQTYQACEAIARQHRLRAHQVVFAQQNPEAIDAGVFHNDVIATGNRDLFFYHELAYTDTKSVVDELQSKFQRLTGHSLRQICVEAKDVSLESAVESYLFNSQLVVDKNGKTVLVAPNDCQRNEHVRAYLQSILNSPQGYIDRVEFVNLHESMSNGGGPACLRLRVVLSDSQLRSLRGNVLLTDELYENLRLVIEKHYPERISPKDLGSPELAAKCRKAAAEVNAVLGLG